MSGPAATGWRRGIAGALWAAAAIVLVVPLWWIDPATSPLLPPCPFHALTGWYCPGCGSLRAVHQLLHGRLWPAVRLNPLMVASLPLIGYALCCRRIRAIRVESLWLPRFQMWWSRVVLVTLVAYWLLRNVPRYPFVLLAPHGPPQ